MNDRAYVVQRMLESKVAIAENNGQNTLFITLDALREIIATLKEQEEIVHCKDCKHRPTWNKNFIDFPDRVCPCLREDYHDSWIPEGDWFCGNGERQ